MLQRLRDYFFQPKIRTAAALRDFVSSQASYLAQRTSLEFTRNTLAYSHQYLIHDEGFQDSLRVCRWESFAALIEDMLVLVESHLRPDDAGDAVRVRAALAGLGRAMLEAYETPRHRAQGWTDIVQRIETRMAHVALARPRAAHQIAAASAERLYDLMPVYSTNKKADRAVVAGAVKFGFSGFAAKLAAALDPPSVRAELLAAAAPV